MKHLIDAAGLSIEDAPEFMLVSPPKLKVSDLTKNKLTGETEWVNNKDRSGNNISCSR